ncbi:hypothetical protein L3X38_035785 [Prunus dulcis]|uniref:Uncharacterized protein n=1 Tax=Prunus dulcis TaxID=3755 RepID=A0AAD4VLC1_PRUDU|nr:hypothetical protein L3X38_035785 [Prunus dulcis]
MHKRAEEEREWEDDDDQVVMAVGQVPQIAYEINNTIYSGRYYLADEIYLRWTTFVKTIPHPQLEKEKYFAAYQEGYRKDVKMCFGILQARWAIIRAFAHMFDEEVLRHYDDVHHPP